MNDKARFASSSLPDTNNHEAFLRDAISSGRLEAALAPIIAFLDQRTRQLVKEELQFLTHKEANCGSRPSNNQLLTVQQAADMLNVKPQTVYVWIQSGRLPAHRIGSRGVRLQHSQVQATLQALTQPDGRRKYARRAN